MGVVFTPEYPFAQPSTPVVPASYTNCEIRNNNSPVPVGDNNFYGCVFENTVFSYSGGRVSFGTNNTLRRCRLVIASGVDENALDPIISMFETVDRETKRL